MEKINVLCVTGHSDRPEAETFIGLHRAGINIEVLCPRSSPHWDRLEAAGVGLTAFQMRSRCDLRAQAVIGRKLRDQKIDILHLFNNQAVNNGIAAAWGVPVKVITYRGIVGNVSYYYPVSYTTHLNWKVDRVVCVAEAVRDYFVSGSFFGLRWPAERFVTIYKGHDLAWYDSPVASLAEFGVPEDAFVVGCMTNVRPRKGVEVLVKSAQYLPVELPVHFLMIGEGMDGPAISRAIADSPLRERFHIAGYRRDAPSLMAACDVSVLPALRREGLPKSIIESMAYECAPIVTATGGSPELVEEGVSGFVVPPGDAKALAAAIEPLARDPARCREIGRRARQRIADHFRISTTIEKTLALYYELLEREIPDSLASAHH